MPLVVLPAARTAATTHPSAGLVVLAAVVAEPQDQPAMPWSASATTASASEGSTLAATVTLRAWFTSRALLTKNRIAAATTTRTSADTSGKFFGFTRRYSRRDGEGFSVAEPRGDLRC